MEKLRFDFAVKTSVDGKSNIVCITSIGTPDGHIFAIPVEYQPASLHQAVTSTSSYIKFKSKFGKLLEKLLEEKQSKSETQNLGKISKDFMIDKFTGRNANANQWIKGFNKECERFHIDEDKRKLKF
ncbi:hypothetical protein EVAR_43379_1 [Eumeta japonica]|uniref:Uncharacterized protein n=1 Tax=Eumeta variegata TaxID=151549 RepID=A0A4C1WQ31_EUMVA|nr:hypothetical protein EVAR_43379_1 [Eumeta japonica]